VGDHIIDTNVLLVASAQDAEQGGDSHFKDSDVPAEQKQKVLKWLIDFRDDHERTLVLDRSFKIWDEYHNKMTRGQDLGSLVVAEKLQFARFVDISFDENDHACLPADLEKVVHDRADRKLVAVALTDASQGCQNNIVNACDCDWYDWEVALNQAGVVVLQLIEDWSRPACKKKRKQKNMTAGQRPAQSQKKTS